MITPRAAKADTEPIDLVPVAVEVPEALPDPRPVVVKDHDGVNWYEETNHIVALPSKALNAYKKNSYGGKNRNISRGYTFPKELIERRKVVPGTYKLYKYRDGFAFKFYERLEDKDEQ